MKKSDKERLKKIVSTWENLSRQIQQRGITPELLLEDEFSQWAVTTPLYNIGEQVYQLSSEFKAAYPELTSPSSNSPPSIFERSADLSFPSSLLILK